MSKTKKSVCRKVHSDQKHNKISNQYAKTQPQRTSETTNNLRDINLCQSSGHGDTNSQLSQNIVAQPNVEEVPNGDSGVVISVVNENIGTYQIPLSELSCLRLDENGILNLDTNSFNFIPSAQKDGDAVDINSNIRGTRGDNQNPSDTEADGILDEPSETNTVTDESIQETLNFENVAVSSDNRGANMINRMDGPNQQSGPHFRSNSSVNKTKTKSVIASDTYSLVQDDHGEGYMLKVHAVKTCNGPKRKRSNYSQYNIPITKPAAVSGTNTIPVVASNKTSLSRTITNHGVCGNTIVPRTTRTVTCPTVPQTFPNPGVCGNTNVPAISGNVTGPTVPQTFPNRGICVNTKVSATSRNVTGPSVLQGFSNCGVLENNNVCAISRNITGSLVPLNPDDVSKNALIPEMAYSTTVPSISRKGPVPTLSNSVSNIYSIPRNVSSCTTLASSTESYPLQSVRNASDFPVPSTCTSGSTGADNTFSANRPIPSGGTYTHSSTIPHPVRQRTSVPTDSEKSDFPTPVLSGMLDSYKPTAGKYISTDSSHQNVPLTALTFANGNNHNAHISLNDNLNNSVLNSSLTVTAHGAEEAPGSARAIRTDGTIHSVHQGHLPTAVSTRELVNLGLKLDKNASVSMNNSVEKTPNLPSGMISNMSASVAARDDFEACLLDCEDNEMYQQRSGNQMYQESSVVTAEYPVRQNKDQVETGHSMKRNDYCTRQSELLRPFCDCNIEAFSPELARGISYLSNGSQMYLMHASSIIIGGKQLVTFEKEGRLFVCVAELRAKNLIIDLKRFTYLLKTRESMTNLNEKEMEFLIQKKCIDNKKQKRCLSLDHLRWIYKTMDRRDQITSAFANSPWYVLRLGHWCPKVATLKGMKQQVCPICHRVEYRPILGGSQHYACNNCSNKPNTQLVAVTNNSRSHVVPTSLSGSMTAPQHAQEEQVPPVRCGHLEISGKYVCAYKCGENTYVNCCHLMKYLHGFPWKNFVDLAMSLKVSFLEAPGEVVGYFLRRSYARDLLMGKVWCSLQDLRCISCFSVGQMNNTDFLVKNQMLPLIAQHQYKEVFPMHNQEKRAITAAAPLHSAPSERVMSVCAIQERDIPVVRRDNNLLALQSSSGFSGSRPQQPSQQRQIILVENRTEIPTGVYHVRERENYKDIERDDGKVVYRLMNTEPNVEVPSTSMDLLSIATKEIMASASSNFADDLESDDMLEYVQSTDANIVNNILSIETSNDDTCMSQIPNSSQIVQMNNSTTLPGQNMSSIADKNFSERNQNTVEGYQNMNCESLVPEPKQDILSMPNSFFENSPQTSKKKKHFLSPTKLGQLSAKGILNKETIVIQNENGEEYECTPLCLVHELEESGYLTEANRTPVRHHKLDPNTSNPKSVKNLADSLKAISSRYENSPDSGISDERSELCTPGSKTTESSQLQSLHEDLDAFNERSEWCTPESISTKDCHIPCLTKDQNELDMKQDGFSSQSQELESSSVPGETSQLIDSYAVITTCEQKDRYTDFTTSERKESSTHDVTSLDVKERSKHVTMHEPKNSCTDVTTREGKEGYADVTTCEGKEGYADVTTCEGKEGYADVTTCEGKEGYADVTTCEGKEGYADVTTCEGKEGYADVTTCEGKEGYADVTTCEGKEGYADVTTCEGKEGYADVTTCEGKESYADVTTCEQKEGSANVMSVEPFSGSNDVTTFEQKEGSAHVTLCNQNDGSNDATAALCLDISDSGEEYLPSAVSNSHSLDTPFISPKALAVDLPKKNPTKKDGDDSINLSILASVAEIASPYEVSESASPKEQESLVAPKRTVKAGILSGSDVEESSSFVDVSLKDKVIEQSEGEYIDSLKSQNAWNESVLDLSEKSSEEASVSDSEQGDAVAEHDDGIAGNDEVDDVETRQEQTKPKESLCDSAAIVKSQTQEELPSREKTKIFTVTDFSVKNNNETEVSVSVADSPEKNRKDRNKSKGSNKKNFDKEGENLIQLGLKLQDMIQKQSGKYGKQDTCLPDNEDMNICQDKKWAKDAKHRKSKTRKKTKKFPTGPSDQLKHMNVTKGPVAALSGGQISEAGQHNDVLKMKEQGGISIESSSSSKKCDRLLHEPNKTFHKHKRHKKAVNNDDVDIGEPQNMDSSDQIDICIPKTDDGNVCEKILGKKRKRTHSSKRSNKKQKTGKDSSFRTIDLPPMDMDDNVVGDNKLEANQNDKVYGAENNQSATDGAKDSVNVDEHVDGATDNVLCDNSVTEETGVSASVCDEWWRNLSNMQKVQGILNRVKIHFLKETQEGIQFQRQVDPSIYRLYGESEVMRQWLDDKLNTLVKLVFLKRKYSRLFSQKDSEKIQMKSREESGTAAEESSHEQVAASCRETAAASHELEAATYPEMASALSLPTGLPAANSFCAPSSSKPVPEPGCCVPHPHSLRGREKSADRDSCHTIEVMVECDTNSSQNRDLAMSVDSCEISPGSSVL